MRRIIISSPPPSLLLLPTYHYPLGCRPHPCSHLHHPCIFWQKDLKADKLTSDRKTGKRAAEKKEEKKQNYYQKS